MADEAQGITAYADVTLRQAPRNDQEWETFLERYANDRPESHERPEPKREDSSDSLLLVEPSFTGATSSNAGSGSERTRAEERQRLRETYEKLGYLPGPEPLEASMIKRRRMVCRLGLANVEIEASKRAVIDNFTKLAKLMFNVESAEAALVTADNALRRVGHEITPGTINFKIGVCPHYGLDSGAAPTTAIENHDFFHRGPIVLPDLREDWRFAKNPTITHPTQPTLFYASVPLVVERAHGQSIDIGTFCLSGSKPKHDFTAKDGEMLTQYAALLVKQLQTLQGEQNFKRVGALQMASIDFIRRSVQPEVFRSQDSQNRRPSADGPRAQASFDAGSLYKPKHRSSGDSLNKHSANPLIRTSTALASHHGERPKFRTAPRSIRQMDMFQQDKEALLYSDACSTLHSMLGADTVTIVDLSEYHIYIRRASASKDGTTASGTTSRDGRPSLQATKEQLSSEFFKTGTVWPPESEPLVHRVPRYSTMSTPGSSDHGPRILASTAHDEKDIYDFSSAAAVDLLGDLLKSYLTSRRVWWSRENKSDPLGARIAKIAPADVNTNMILPSLDIGGRAHFAVFASWKSAQPQSLQFNGDLQFVRMLCGATQASLAIKRMRELEQSQISYSNLQAHELRTPTHQLLAITALLRTALQDLANAPISEETTVLTTTQQVRDLLPYLDAIDTAGRTLHDIIDNILSFLELRSKDNPLDKHPSVPSVPTAQHTGAPRSLEVMFEDVIQQVSEDQRQVRKLLGRTTGRIETVFEIVPPLLGESLEEDNGGALESALLKILSNAYKFINGDGYVQITVDDIPSLLPPAGYDDMAASKRVSIKIEDSGKGMDAAFLENRLFEPFAKEDPFTPGSGLSVHLAHRIIDLMGGQMAVSSTPGRGSTVYIEIPLPRREITVDGDDSAASLTGQASQISPGRRVFLAGFEDQDGADYGVRRLGVSLERQFKKLGCTLTNDVASADTVVAEGRCEEDENKLRALLETVKINDVVFLVDDAHSACSASESLASQRQIQIRRFRKPMTPAVLREILHPDHADAISSTPSSLNTPQSAGEVSAVNSPEAIGPNGSASSSGTWTATSATPRSRQTVGNIEDTIASLSMGDYFSSRRKSLRRTQPRNRLPSPISPLTQEQLSASPEPSPRLDTSQPSPVTPTTPASPSLQPSLMVVEDNKINRVILCQMLRGLKAKIIEAVDGVEAVEAFRKLDEPAVILLDINMPRMDGFAACTEFRAIEASEGRQKSWVIAVTALGSDAERQRGVVVGIDVWMQKPCGKAVISKAVEEGRKRLQG